MAAALTSIEEVTSGPHRERPRSPPLDYEPAAANELVEEADTLLQRTWYLGYFRDPDLERAYQEWHAKLLRSRLSMINFAFFICFTVAAVSANINEHSLKNMVQRVHPNFNHVCLGVSTKKLREFLSLP